ncbi:MAG: hypothetical protein B6D79_01345 [gamma proteobacterium symbiont of Ctena orbiculata]|nr:MAG: hypothetical protein B6D79_01345 [gamma proteobacterium symbiont of Ctena orbiculata]
MDLDVKNTIRVGDRLELMTPAGNRSFELQRMEDQNGNPMQEAPGGGYRVRVELPTHEVENALLCRYLEPA